MPKVSVTMPLLSGPALGYLGCFLAVIGFGTQGTFVKSKVGPESLGCPRFMNLSTHDNTPNRLFFPRVQAIRKAGTHPALVALVFSAFVGLAAVLGILFLLTLRGVGASKKILTEHGGGIVLAALAFAPGNVLLLLSCRRVGVGLAVGVTASTTTLTSFIMGVAVLHDNLRSTTQVRLSRSTPPPRWPPFCLAHLTQRSLCALPGAWSQPHGARHCARGLNKGSGIRRLG